MSRRLTTAQFIARAESVHSTTYTYDEVEYKSMHSKVVINCPIHGSFTQTPANHLAGKGCFNCTGTRLSTTDEFVEKAALVHNGKYDYTDTIYVNAKSDLKIRCPDHGMFEQVASSHLSGYGCSRCSENHRYTTDEFISKAQDVHSDWYDYSLTEYNGYSHQIKIICPDHGMFEQVAGYHMAGSGCSMCGNVSSSISKMLSIDEFINRSDMIHSYKYSYDHVIYTGSKQPVLILCPDHGEFHQTPDAHLVGKGCPRCTTRVSKSSQRWLDALNIPDTPTHREVGGLIANERYIVDGYDPNTNTVYEFHGDYWHGNPKLYNADDINPSTGTSYGELYERTQNKKVAFIKCGYTYVEMWESDWV